MNQPLHGNPLLCRPGRPKGALSTALSTALGSALLSTALACTLAGGVVAPAHAHRNASASSVSAMSALPLAISVAMPVVLLVAGTSLVVKSVELSAQGAVWVLERASDGLYASVTLGANAAEGLSVAVGTVVLVAAVSAGWVLYAGSKAIAFIPNEIGKALTYNERVTR